MEESQLLKGILEACVLQIIAQKETYGYEILTKLHNAGFQTITEGTLYPILTRLEKKNFIIGRKAKSPLGPMRKYFRITPLGTSHLSSYIEIYKKTIQNANAILLI